MTGAHERVIGSEGCKRRDERRPARTAAIAVLGVALAALLSAEFVVRSAQPLAATLATAFAQDIARRGPDPRIQVLLNDAWRYAPGPVPDAEEPAFDDRTWQSVDLPHTWNAGDAFDEEPGYRRGEGWYRRTLAVDGALAGKRLFLFFEGANQVADVFVNGRAVGRHVGGYTAFAFDITPYVDWGDPNIIAVRVDNSHDPEIPPLDADFTFYGGIYRDVWLVATDSVHVDVLDHASPGIFVDTPDISAERATVRIRGTVVNHTGARKRVEVSSRILHPSDREVAVLSTRLDVPAHGSAIFQQTTSPIQRPALWSPSAPNLYRVVTEVRDGDRIRDRVENPLGFRWFEVDPRRGFSLNGKPLVLSGTNRHQDRAGHGNAVVDQLHREDVRLIRGNGFNFVRLAHYPQDPAVLEETDRRGLLVWEEIPVVNLITPSREFSRSAERMLTEMIRQHYNHPSVIFWGYMNEVTLRRPEPLPEGYYDRVLELAERLDARAHAEDPSRATVMALSAGEVQGDSRLQYVSDVLGFNLYFGWYYGAFDSLATFLDAYNARHLDRPILVSEYGAGSDERVHTMEPQAFDFSIEYQQRFHESHLPMLRDRPYLLGYAVWNQFDFGSAGRQDTKPGINQKGLYFFDRVPKDVAYFYRASLRPEPVVWIATRDWRRRAGSRPEDRRQPVVVYANSSEVELELDGESLGRQVLANAAGRWIVPFRHGSNSLRARARRGGETVEDSVTVYYEDRTMFFAGAGGEAGARMLAVNAGAHYQFVDRQGVVWEADRPYEPGSWGYVAEGRTRRTHHAIRGTEDEPLFQATREGVPLEYRFDLPDGTYEVRLLFAEIEHDAAGARMFSVHVNGQPVISDLDLTSQDGRYVATQRAIEVTAVNGAGIDVLLRPKTGMAAISGILVGRQ